MSDLVEFMRARVDEDERQAKHEIDLGAGAASGWGGPTPERMLAEVAAKRAIVEVHRELPEEFAYCQECDSHELWPCRTLRHLAAVYSGHDDYREEEWAP